MIRRTTLLVALACLAVAAPGTRGDLLLSLSTPDDLANLQLGASAEFDIALSGVNAAESPGFLKAVIAYDPAVLFVTAIAPGSIVPDVGGFDATGSSTGVVSAYYDDSYVPSDPISTDGLFYRFTATRIGGGASTVVVGSFAAQDDSGNDLALSANPDSVTIRALAAPEPASFTLAVLGGAVVYLGRICRHARR